MNEIKLVKNVRFIVLPVIFLAIHYYLSNLVYYGMCRILIDVLKVSEEFFMKYPYIIEVATYIVILIPLMIIYYLLFKKRGVNSTNFSSKVVAMSVGLGIGVSGVSYLWMIFLDKVLINIPIFRKSLEFMEQANESLGNGSVVGVFLIAVILAPLIEELLFRGIIFNYLEKSKIRGLAIIGSSILFGAYHMNLVQAVYATFMGIVAAIIYQKTRNLLYPVLVHMANNFVGAIQDVLSSQEFIIDIINIFAVVMIVVMIFITSNLKRSIFNK